MLLVRSSQCLASLVYRVATGVGKLRVFELGDRSAVSNLENARVGRFGVMKGGFGLLGKLLRFLAVYVCLTRLEGCTSHVS
jgi:hypothetical protein